MEVGMVYPTDGSDLEPFDGDNGLWCVVHWWEHYGDWSAATFTVKSLRREAIAEWDRYAGFHDTYAKLRRKGLVRCVRVATVPVGLL